MKEITLDAYGKLNLTLDILGRRPDGYHDLRMVMQSVSLCDRVTIRETENGQIALRTSASYLPCDRGNLAYRAAEAFFAAVDVANPGVALYVEKRIPVCAGMAGRSSPWKSCAGSASVWAAMCPTVFSAERHWPRGAARF